MSDKYSAPNIRNIGAKDKAECLKINMENRIRDLGVGCDLICLGEQPLHAVPLFRIIISGGDKYEYDGAYVDVTCDGAMHIYIPM